MTLDGLLNRINYDLLRDLRRNGLQVGRVRVQSRPRGPRRGSSFSSADGGAYFAAISPAATKARYLCDVGPYPLIVNIELTNGNLRFANSYEWRDILDRRTVVIRSTYDSKRGEQYDRDVERYRSYMDGRLSQYAAAAKAAIAAREESYVDPCYVDAGYVAPQYDVEA